MQFYLLLASTTKDSAVNQELKITNYESITIVIAFQKREQTRNS